jgi:flavin-binding protein dodecin
MANVRLIHAIMAQRTAREQAMSEKVYKLVEVVGTSSESIEAAINNGIARVSATMERVAWFEVLETRGFVEGGSAGEFQVRLKIGFLLKEGSDAAG